MALNKLVLLKGLLGCLLELDGVCADYQLVMFDRVMWLTSDLSVFIRGVNRKGRTMQ